MLAECGWIRRARKGILFAQGQILRGRGRIRRARYRRFYGTMEENKPNEDSDAEKEIDDDGDRPLRGISKRSTSTKDHGVCVHPEQHVVGRATILAAYRNRRLLI